MAKVQFYKGTYEKIVNTARNNSGIYVATDKPYIFVGDQIIGIDCKLAVGFEWVAESHSLKITYQDGSTTAVKIPTVTTDNAGLMSPENFVKLSNIEENAEANKIDGIHGDDKVLTVDNKKLLTNLSLNYDSGRRLIQLVGKNNEVISQFSADVFVKDGMLYGSSFQTSGTDGTISVTIKGLTHSFTDLIAEHQYLIFCFTDGNAETPSYEWYAIETGNLVKPYTAGDGISIDDTNVVSVALGENTAENKNFLKSTGGKLEVRGIDANSVNTLNDITAIGGPLASQSDNWPTTWYKDGKKIIPANLSLQDFITGLYYKELKGGLVKSETVWNPVAGIPTADLTQSAVIVNDDLLEIGEVVVLNAVQNSSISSNSRTVTVSSDENGFGVYVGNVYYKDSSTFTENGSAAENVSLTIEFNDVFYNANSEVNVSKEGDNVLNVKQSMTTNVNSFTDKPICYGATNTGAINTEASVNVNETGSAVNTKTLITSNTAKVIGVYPIYTNGVPSAISYDENTDCPAPVDVTASSDISKKVPLIQDNEIFTINFPKMIDGGAGWKIAIQKNKTITYAKSRSITGKCDLDILDQFVKSGTVIKKKSGGVDTEYCVWEHTGTKGYNYVSFKID